MSEALIEHLRDLFEPLGPISARAMFGGYGLYFDGVIIGVIMEEALYLKTDAETRDRFEAAGCAPFLYEMKGKVLPMPPGICSSSATGISAISAGHPATRSPDREQQP